MPESVDKQPHLKRVLGRGDLVLLFVVAVFNLNVVPSIAANGGVTVWLWIVSLILFFWPQGIAVIELAHRYPGEGGVYLWAKEVFGDFHGFLTWTAPKGRHIEVHVEKGHSDHPLLLALKAGLASCSGENSTKRASTAAVVTPTKPTAAAGTGSRISATMTVTNSAR